MIECRECGLQLSEGARFCRACGTPVTGEQPAAGGPRPDPDGGYWAAVGRAGADRTGGAGGAPGATVVVPPPPAGPVYAPLAMPPNPPPRRPALVVGVIIGGVVVLLLAGLVGYLLTREDPDDALGSTSSSTSAPPDGSAPSPTRLKSTTITASCTGKKSRDAAGNETTYEPGLVADGNEATAWRCDDDGIGQSLVLRFDEPVRLRSVGLIPGIVKVDATDGTDRFEQNNKIARVRWVFDDGAEEQAFEAAPDLQRMAVDVTTTKVTIEIESVFPGR